MAKYFLKVPYLVNGYSSWLHSLLKTWSCQVLLLLCLEWQYGIRESQGWEMVRWFPWSTQSLFHPALGCFVLLLLWRPRWHACHLDVFIFCTLTMIHILCSGADILICKWLVSHTESEYMNSSIERDLCISQCFFLCDWPLWRYEDDFLLLT